MPQFCSFPGPLWDIPSTPSAQVSWELCIHWGWQRNHLAVRHFRNCLSRKANKGGCLFVKGNVCIWRRLMDWRGRKRVCKKYQHRPTYKPWSFSMPFPAQSHMYWHSTEMVFKYSEGERHVVPYGVFWWWGDGPSKWKVWVCVIILNPEPGKTLSEDEVIWWVFYLFIECDIEKGQTHLLTGLTT